MVTPVAVLDPFANAGKGFHSNDARNVVITQRIGDRVQALRQRGPTDEQIQDQLVAERFDPNQRGSTVVPTGLGSELGTRVTVSDRLAVGASAWLLDLEEEFVFIGDAGTTEPSGRTRHLGIDVEARAQVLPWLVADADVTLSRGHLRDEAEGEDSIPLALSLTSPGALTAHHPSGVRRSLRYQTIGDRPANETNTVTAEGNNVLDALIGVDIGRAEVTLAAENLMDVSWNEAQLDAESRLASEVAPVSELHFTPGNPVQHPAGARRPLFTSDLLRGPVKPEGTPAR